MTEKPLVDKYEPEMPDDIYGHPSAISDIKQWADSWSRDSPPLLLHGPPGTGKTSTGEVMANYADWDCTELNASSQRREEDISKLAQEMRTLHPDNKTLFLLDEVDSMNDSSLQPLYDVLEDCPNPVICTANESWKVPDKLDNLCKKYKFRLQKKSIKNYLKKVVLPKEDIDITNRQVGQLATRNGIRDALHDLQEFSETEGDTDWDERDTDDSPFGVTRRAILNKNYVGDITPDDMIDFLNENVKNEFDGVELLRAYQALAEADRWQSLAERTHDYSWWRYAGPISEEVANLRITEPYNDWVNVNYPASRRNYTPRPQNDTPEAALFEKIKDGSFEASFNFHEFRKAVLPILLSLEEEDKYKLAFSHSVTGKGLKALDIEEEEFESWLMEEDANGELEEVDISNFVLSDGEPEQRSLFSY